MEVIRLTRVNCDIDVCVVQDFLCVVFLNRVIPMSSNTLVSVTSINPGSERLSGMYLYTHGEIEVNSTDMADIPAAQKAVRRSVRNSVRIADLIISNSPTRSSIGDFSR